MTKLEVVLPFWLDRPDREALEIARTVSDSGFCGFEALWIGEMATYDAFALATAIGLRASELPLKIGPLAVGVRGPVTLALGVSTVASLTGNRVDLALGASSPAIVAGWHNRSWAHHVPVMRETIECLRPMLAGERVTYHGRHVSSTGFRLRNPVPEARIAVGAFGPGMIELAAQQADEVVLNLASPARVSQVRQTIDRAVGAGRAPRLTVWVPVALDPGPGAHAQLAGQLGVYLAPPGYGEMFSALGFADLVQRARAGTSTRRDLAAAVPVELLDTVCALGSATRIAQRLREYREAGADCVAVVPGTAEDAGGRRVLTALSQEMP